MPATISGVSIERQVNATSWIRYLMATYSATMDELHLLPPLADIDMIWQSEHLQFDAVQPPDCPRSIAAPYRDFNVHAPSAASWISRQVGQNGLQFASLPSHVWAEVTHCGGSHFEQIGVWHYVARGSAIYVNTGKTLAFGVHADAARYFLRQQCKWRQCDEHIHRVLVAARRAGYDSIQFLKHCDTRCALECGHELVLTYSKGFAACPAGVEYRTGIHARNACSCVSDKHRSLRGECGSCAQTPQVSGKNSSLMASPPPSVALPPPTALASPSHSSPSTTSPIASLPASQPTASMVSSSESNVDAGLSLMPAMVANAEDTEVRRAHMTDHPTNLRGAEPALPIEGEKKYCESYELYDARQLMTHQPDRQVLPTITHRVTTHSRGYRHLTKGDLHRVVGLRHYLFLPSQSASGANISIDHDELECRRTHHSASMPIVRIHHNGIVSRGVWPPRCTQDFTRVRSPWRWHGQYADFSLNAPRSPRFELQSSAIRIDIGRQLFVDDFLIARASNCQRRWHAARLASRLDTLDGYRLFSDGIVWDPVDQTYRAWASDPQEPHATKKNDTLFFSRVRTELSGTTALVSKDGLKWTRLGALTLRSDGLLPRRNTGSVWLDRDDVACPYKFAFYKGRFILQLFCSKTPIGPLDEVGSIYPAGDRSTFAFNAFTRKWVFMLTGVQVNGMRHVSYFERASFEGNHSETACKGRERPCCRLKSRVWFSLCDSDAALETAKRFGCWSWNHRSLQKGQHFVNWLSSDTHDGLTPYQGRPTDVYAADYASYESITLIGMGIYRAGHEVDKDISLSLGFSRDGFHYVRPQPRFDFAMPQPRERQYYPSFSGGLLCVHKDHLDFYISSLLLRSNSTRTAWVLAHELLKKTRGNRNWGEQHWAKENEKIVRSLHDDLDPVVSLFRLRRDGFASISPIVSSKAPAILETHLLRFNGTRLFINAKVPAYPESSLQVRLLSAENAELARSYELAAFDSTAKPVAWRKGGLSESEAVHRARLKFIIRGEAQVFAFWFASDDRGGSAGKLPPCAPVRVPGA